MEMIYKFSNKSFVKSTVGIHWEKHKQMKSNCFQHVLPLFEQ